MFFRDEVWIFLRHGQMFKVMLTSANEVVFLTPPPELKCESLTPQVTKSEDKLSLRKVQIIYTVRTRDLVESTFC